jgi:hypothetical protein
MSVFKNEDEVMSFSTTEAGSFQHLEMALCLFFSSAGSGGFTTPSFHRVYYPLWATLPILPPPT